VDIACADASAADSPERLADATTTLKLLGLPQALLLTFGGATLETRPLRPSGGHFPDIPLTEMLRGAPIPQSDEMMATLLCRAALRIGRTHGLGYRQATYRGLLMADFAAEGMDHAASPTAEIRAFGISLGEHVFAQGIVFQRHGLVIPCALRESIRSGERTAAQAALRHLNLPWALIANYSRRNFDWRWVARDSERGN
jgi:hypothetical protein